MSFDNEKELSKFVHNRFGPALKSEGWLRNKGWPGWYRNIGCGYFFFGFYVQSPWDYVGQNPMAYRILFDISVRQVNPKLKSIDWGGGPFVHRRLERLLGLKKRVTPNESTEGRDESSTQIAQGMTPAFLKLLDQSFRAVISTEEHVIEVFDYLVNRLPSFEEKMKAVFEEKFPGLEAIEEFQAVDHTPWSEIVENPDDDTPRLVFADWLEERGDARAEFIRLQIEHASLPEGTTKSIEVNRTANGLLRNHGDAWLARFSKLPISDPQFHRGFVNQVRITANQLINNGEKIFAQLPLIEYVHLVQAADRLVELSECESLRHIKSIRFTEKKAFQIEGWEALLNSPHFSKLEELAIREKAASIHSLFSSSLLCKLKAIDLTSSGLNDSHLLALCSIPSLPKLRVLKLNGNNLSSGATALLADSTAFQNLEELDISLNRIGNKGLNMLLRSDAFPNLKVLRTHNNRLTDKAIDALLKEHGMRSLEAIQIDGSTMNTLEAIKDKYRIIGSYYSPSDLSQFR